MNRVSLLPADHSSRSTLLALLLTLGAETVLFGMLVMSYLFLRANTPNLAIPHFRPFDFALAAANTIILLTSAVFAWSASGAVERGAIGRLKFGLLAALALGMVFVLGQVFEFSHSGLKIDSSTFSGVFFALVSFHALHVLGGMTLLGLNYARARLGDFNARRHTAVSVGTWFWYYVTAVWLVLFALLYLV
jgi:heme/copper-type cytochrome/quinol oxidase subunit 3